MIAIAEAFDAMITGHVYRPARSLESAMTELFECAGHAVRSRAGAAIRRVPPGRSRRPAPRTWPAAGCNRSTRGW